MSATRHADPSAPLAQERYMSSVEYRELRGISGNAVTARAALLDHPAKKGLVFFLQALSLKPGGMPKVCADFLARFADRIGTPTMHEAKAAGAAAGEPLPNKTALQIRHELHPICVDEVIQTRRTRLRIEAAQVRRMNAYAKGEITAEEYAQAAEAEQKAERELPADERTLECFMEDCLEQSAELSALLTELCVNPEKDFPAPGENTPDYPRSSPRWFDGLIPALYEFRARYERAIHDEFVMTEIGRLVFDTLDVAPLAGATGKMVVVEGNSGIGKTTATEAWCNLHLGEARYVSISGITTKTGVFRAIAKALGLASSYARTATEMQSRIEDVLQRSKLTLIIDEAHFLMNGATRVYCEPELMNWLYTAIANQRVPCGLVCTPQFKIRADRARKQTGWNLDQLKRRVFRYEELPFKPCMEDLQAVAKRLLPGVESNTVKMIVGYSLTCPMALPGLINAIDEAKLLASKAGREQITFADAERAIEDYCHPSARAWEVPETKAATKRGRKPWPEPPAPALANSDGLPLHRPAPQGRKNDLTGIAPVGDSPARRTSAPLAQPSRSAAAEVVT